MSRIILDVHILQTVPPSNLNRDDTGAPKTAVYGGVQRARVSSQAWKRATRQAFDEMLDKKELAVRTRKVAALLAQHITAVKPALAEGDAATALAKVTLEAATGSKIEPPKRKVKDGEPEPAPESAYLMFLSRRQLDTLAALAVEGAGAEGDPKALEAFLKAKENKARARQAVNSRHSVDIALFGRMVADSADLNVDAATQVAHAISVHRVDEESDYYTAVDDENAADESGAGMIGTVEFNSATLYRYAALDVNALHENLGAGLHEGERAALPTQRAAAAFVEAFAASLPTGKVNSFGHNTLPAAVIVKVRTRRPVSFVAAFEAPVRRDEHGGFLEGACQQLAKYVPELESAYGLGEGSRGWVLRVGDATADLAALGEQVTLAELREQVEAEVAARLGVGGTADAGGQA